MGKCIYTFKKGERKMNESTTLSTSSLDEKTAEIIIVALNKAYPDLFHNKEKIVTYKYMLLNDQEFAKGVITFLAKSLINYENGMQEIKKAVKQ